MKRDINTDPTFNALRTAEQEEACKPYKFGDSTQKRIADLTGITDSTVIRHLHYLRAEGRAHIHDWTPGMRGGAIWVSGPGIDKPQPEPKDRVDVMMLRKRQRASSSKAYWKRQEERLTEVDPLTKAQRLNAQSIEQAKRNPHHPFTALFLMAEAA